MSAPTRTTCPYCGVGCGLVAETSGGRLRAVRGDQLHPVNRGRTCRKPLALPAAVHAGDRATTPLMRERRDTRFRAETWDRAMPALAARLRSIADEHGPGAIAFYVSGQLLTEDYYAVNKLAKGFLGTNNVDSNSRLCMSSAVAGYTGAFGSDGPPPAYADLALADCLLLVGTNAAACHPVVWSKIADRRAEGAFVICADPRRTPTAEGSDLHLPVRPGTDLPLLNAMLCTIDREGLADEAFLARHTSGWEQARATAHEWPPERAAEVCGVPAADIVEAARRFGRAPRAMALWSMGANQSTVGTLKNRALINLCLATGQIGRPGTGPLSLTGQPNAMGGRETGALAHLLPGYRRVESPEDRAEMERLWRLPPQAAGIASEPGLPAVELFDALHDGRVRAVWIAATNPAVSLPDGERARAALERAELVVVQDAYHPTETSALAHAVLPAAAWPEKDGTMTNSERRLSPVRRALDPPGQALPDWRIVARLAAELGFAEHFAWASAAEVFDEFAACTTGRVCDVSGIDRELLLREGSAQWPRPAEPTDPEPIDPARTDPKRLYTDHRYPTPDGRARLAPTPHAPPADAQDGDFPLMLTTGRVADQWHTMTRTGKAPELLASAPEPFLELHPDDARGAGVADGELVRVVSRRGEAVLRARVQQRLPPGVAFAPFHWGGLHAPPGAGAVNAATSPAVDPVSRQPELKAAAVRLEPAGRGPARRRARGRARRRLVVVGTGMAGLELVEEVRRRRPAEDWSITMLGEEPGPAYNRMQLSKVLARTAGPGALELRPAAWYAARDVDLRGGSAAVAIDLDHRTVQARDGGRHRFDALVLATGSRAFVPPVPGADRSHVLRFRTRAHTEAIAAGAGAGRSAVVVGGGLLGLEAAAGIRTRGARVTVVEAAGRLMPQQLDEGGARALTSALTGLGIEARTGVAVQAIGPRSLQLASGEELAADVVVMAAGVRAETALARHAGIEVERGVMVDDELRTSAPGVWAVGECAEHRGVVHGLWAPVAAQARAAGASVCGDPAAFLGAVPATTLKVAGVDVFAGGRAEAADGQVEVLWSDGRSGAYRKLVLRPDGSLAGALLVGDAEGARELSALLREGGAVPEEMMGPSSGGATQPEGAPDRDALVCSCNAVSAGTIQDAIRDRGLTTVEQVGASTRAGTGCGSCASDIGRLLARGSSSRNTTVTDAKPAPATMGA